VIEHYTPDGRQVYTVAEAAELRGITKGAQRNWMLRRARRSGVPLEPADWINSKEPVYYPDDLGLEN
jgi:hypothetical protein